MIAAGVVALEAIACIGIGAAILKALRIFYQLPTLDRFTWSFALGFGVLGWLVFFFGIFGGLQSLPLLSLLVAGALGSAMVGRIKNVPQISPEFQKLGPWEWAIVFGITAALIFDLFEGLSPPAEADTLAYHFTLPKQFIAAGKLVFVPRAIDGATPLLVQMSYIPALALGGERALTLWTMISGWAATALLFTLTRRFLDLRWSLALALIFLTTPAVLYGGGNGQVEIRNALFVMVAAFAVAQALKTGLLRYAVLAGLAAGFFMATKYLGLLFVAAAGLVILAQKKWFMHGAVFLLAALIAGGQWYIWNYTHTGDPVFPMLYGMLDYLNPDYWNTAYQQIFETLFRLDKAVPANSLWFFAYPFAATFGLYDVFESGRTGMGPFVLLALLFATFGLWRFRGHLIRSPLLPVAVLAGIFYGLWFFTASSQRVRHLLPVYPLVLLCVMVAAHRWATETGHLKPLAGAVLLTCLIQLAGQAVFGMSYGRYVLTGETREAFLLRTVRGYAPVPWINKNLGKNDLIYTQERQLIYLFDVPVYYGHWALDARIDTRPAADDPVKFFRQLTAQSISHLLVQGEMPAPGRYDRSKAKGYGLWRELAVRGCLETVKSIKGPSFGSRTLKTMVTNTTFHILKLKSPACLDNEKAPRL